MKSYCPTQVAQFFQFEKFRATSLVLAFLGVLGLQAQQQYPVNNQTSCRALVTLYYQQSCSNTTNYGTTNQVVNDNTQTTISVPNGVVVIKATTQMVGNAWVTTWTCGNSDYSPTTSTPNTACPGCSGGEGNEVQVQGDGSMTYGTRIDCIDPQ